MGRPIKRILLHLLLLLLRLRLVAEPLRVVDCLDSRSVRRCRRPRSKRTTSAAAAAAPALVAAAVAGGYFPSYCSRCRHNRDYRRRFR